MTTLSHNHGHLVAAHATLVTGPFMWMRLPKNRLRAAHTSRPATRRPPAHPMRDARATTEYPEASPAQTPADASGHRLSPLRKEARA